MSLHSWGDNDHCRYCGEFYMSFDRVDPCPGRSEEPVERNTQRSPKIPGTALYDHRKTFVHKR